MIPAPQQQSSHPCIYRSGGSSFGGYGDGGGPCLVDKVMEEGHSLVDEVAPLHGETALPH